MCENKEQSQQKATSSGGQVDAIVMPECLTEKCIIGGKIYDADCLNNTMQKAVKLAVEFRTYCIEHNISCTTEIAGVAWDAQWIKSKAYMDGVKHESRRIADLLGVGETS